MKWNNSNYGNYNELVGKTKSEVIASIGSENNYYHNDIWYYQLSVSWYGRKTYLFLHFDEEIVLKIKIMKSFK